MIDVERVQGLGMGRHSVPDPTRTPRPDPTDAGRRHDPGGRRPRPSRATAIRSRRTAYAGRLRRCRHDGASDGRTSTATTVTTTATTTTGYDDDDYDDDDYDERDSGSTGYDPPRRPCTGRGPDTPTASCLRHRPAVRRRLDRTRTRRRLGRRRVDRQPPRDPARRRGVSVGVIAALVTVVVVVGAVILWRFFGDALSNRSQAGAARCVRGRGRRRRDRRPVDRGSDRVRSPTSTTRPPTRSATDASRSASSPPTRMRWSTGSSGTWPANSVSARRCGFPAARCRRPGSKRRPASRPSATAARWSPRRWCWPSGRS